MSPLPPPLTPCPLPGGDTPGFWWDPCSLRWQRTVHVQEAPSALLARLQVMAGICNPLSAVSLAVSLHCVCGTHLWTLLHQLRFGQRVIKEWAKRGINTVIIKQGGFSSVFWGKPGCTLRSSACIAKTREVGEGKRSESCTVPVSLPSAVRAWRPVNKDRVQFSVHTAALTVCLVKWFCFQ